MIGGVSAPDPYVIHEPSDPTILPGYRTIDGLTQVDPRLVAGETTEVIVVGGQSLVSNYTQTAFAPVNAKVQVLNIYNGGIYAVNANVLPGCGGILDNYFKRVADDRITQGKAARVILVPIGVSSMLFADFAAGGQMNHRIAVAGLRLSALGLTASYVCWEQGQSDNVAATSQATCTAGLNSIIAALQAALGGSVPIYVAKCSYYLGATAANVTNAQAAVVSGTIKAGPNIDSLNSSNRYDNIHLNATGAAAAVPLWRAVLP